MSLWQFYCVQEGFRAFHNPPSAEDKTKPPTNEEFEAAVARFADI